MKKSFTEKFWFYYPVIATIVFEMATGGQILRMIREKSAMGQEPVSWLLVILGLLGWAKWYKKNTPEHKLPRFTAMGSAMFHTIALGICIYFKYLYHSF